MEPQYQRADYHQRQLYADEHAEFRIAPVYFQATPLNKEMQAIVTTGISRKIAMGINGGTVKIATLASCVEAADSDSGEAVSDVASNAGIPANHGASAQATVNERHIDKPQHVFAVSAIRGRILLSFSSPGISAR